MKILAVETSAVTCSAAYFDGTDIIEEFADTGLNHSCTLMPMVDRVLRRAGASASGTEVFACSCGPGSFTGVRIGVAAVKGMASAAGGMCAGVSTLETIAMSAPEEFGDGNICCVETTPLDFYHSIIPDDYDENSYIMIMNDPTREYYKLYEISNYRNTVEGVNWVYLNLPVEDIKKAALASIKNGDAMYASCDMPQFDAASGIASTGLHDYESLFGINLDMDKKARILTRDSGSAHAMALVAVDTDVNDVPVKWQFENSWGANSCHDGYITFTDDWFDEYVFRIVINKKYLDRKALSSLKGEPEELPAWDYMF